MFKSSGRKGNYAYTVARVKAKKAGLFVSLWPGQSIDDFILGVALGADALCCDRAVEVKEFFDEHMPWVEAR